VTKVDMKADQEHNKAFSHRSLHAEDESISFGLGFLVSVSVRSGLKGCLPGMEWEPEDTGTHQQTSYLLAAVIIFGFLVVCASVLRRITKDDDDSYRRKRERFADISELTMSMAMGWSLLYWGYWIFWDATGGQGFSSKGNLMVCNLELVMIFTFFSFIMLIIVDAIADRSRRLEAAMRALQEAFVLLLGLSWEGSFIRAMDSVDRGSSETARTGVLVGVVVVLCAMVIPAWIWYILPAAQRYEVHDGDADEVHPEHHSEVSTRRMRIASERNVGNAKTFTVEDLKDTKVTFAILAYLNEQHLCLQTICTAEVEDLSQASCCADDQNKQHHIEGEGEAAIATEGLP